MAKRNFTLVSLFSGAGGLDWGFHSTGNYKIKLANEIRAHAARTYSDNFQEKIAEIGGEHFKKELPAVFLGSVEDLKFSELEGDSIDVVVGGPPCQDFSVVRGPSDKRQGIEVKRGRLYSFFVSALVHFRPKVFVFENVPGLISANKGLAYEQIQQDFENLHDRWDVVKKVIGENSGDESAEGYELIFKDILSFAKLGVPQKRRRLIVIGVRKDLLNSRSAASFWDAEEAGRRYLGHKNLLEKFPLSAMEVFEGRPLNEIGNLYPEIMREFDGVWKEVDTERAHRWKRIVWDKLTFDAVEDYLEANSVKEPTEQELELAFAEHKTVLKELGYYRTRVESLQLPDKSNKIRRESESVTERMRRIPPDENHLFVENTPWEVNGRGMSLIYRRLHPLKPSYTVVAHGGGGTWGYHYKKDRSALTNRERARLQTFPDNFYFRGSNSDVRSQIGEAVPPLAGKRIAELASEILTNLC